MSSFNRVILMGNLTRDVEIKNTTSRPVANISIALNRKFKTKDDGQKEETTFVDCEAWGNTAEMMAKYLHKGRTVHVEGRLKQDRWQDKDGNNRSRLLVLVENFEFVGPPNDTDRRASKPSNTQSKPVGVSEDDIPF